MRVLALSLVTFALLAGCSSSDGDTPSSSGSSAFACVGPCVGDLELSLPKGKKHDGPLPAATSRGDEPVIAHADWVPVKKNVFALELHLESETPVRSIFIEINGAVYEIEASPMEGASYEEIDACNILAEQQGYGCTEACLEACACASCDDPMVENNMVKSCAMTCSIYSHEGLLGSEPYTDEAVYADIVYNGSPEHGLPGLMQSIPTCRSKTCSDRAAASKRKSQRVQFRFNFHDNRFVPNLAVGNLVAIADPPSGAPAVSEPVTAPAKLNLEQNGCIRF
jgi:hypothetical protein